MAAWERRRLATERDDFLVIDEVQDVTPVELRLALATLRDKSAFLLCGDSNQIVHPNLFSWARVKSLFHAEGGRDAGPWPLDRIHVLSANTAMPIECVSGADREPPPHDVRLHAVRSCAVA